MDGGDGLRTTGGTMDNRRRNAAVHLSMVGSSLSFSTIYFGRLGLAGVFVSISCLRKISY